MVKLLGEVVLGLSTNSDDFYTACHLLSILKNLQTQHVVSMSMGSSSDIGITTSDNNCTN